MAMVMAMASASSSSASVAVEKATSDLLIGPDWTMNIDICDSVNSNHWMAKDVVKAVKKRLQHKNPKVQLLALTLLETMVKNCGDYVHYQIAEKNILGEMVKIVKKKTDMHVRDKILVLLDSWQEAFGGPGGKHPQYYWAYEELRRSGVEFPQRFLDAAPIFTPPATRSTLRHAQAGYGMPSNSSRRLDETMATESEGLSLSGLDSMRNVMELLSDMLQAVNPDDCGAVKDEIIVDLVTQCRSNQKKLMQMLTTTGDEELLGKGLELNDSLQILLAKHDAIASGSPMPTQVTNLVPKLTEGHSSSIKPTEVIDSNPSSSSNASLPVATVTKSNFDEEDEEEDDFAQLARRHSKTQSSPPQGTVGTSKALVPVDTTTATSPAPSASNPAPCTALALPDTSASVRNTKEQDIIDLLNISLSTSHVAQTPHTPAVSHQSMPQEPASSSAQGYPFSSQTYPENQGQAAYNNYVVPWALPQPQHQLQRPTQPHLEPQIRQHLQPQSQPQAQNLPQHQQQFHPQSQLQPQPHSPTQAQQQFQPQPQLQQHTRPQQQFQAQSQSQPHTQPQQQFLPQSQSEPHFHPRTQQQFQPQSQPVSHVQPQPQQQFQPQSQPQPHTRTQLQPQQQQFQPQSQSQPQLHPQSQPQQPFQPQSQRQFQPQLRSQYQQYSSGYPPPPWAATPGYANGQSHMSTTSNMFSTPQGNSATSYTPASGTMPHYNSLSKGSNGSALNGDPHVSSGPRNPAPPGQKPFIPSYRLFEDLNVLSSTDGRFKMTGSASPSLSGPSSQGMVGGRK